jgi:hypothetical protein
MTSAKDQTRHDKTARERRKKLSKQEIRDLELAGGVEGGMQAGSAGGPGENDSGGQAGRAGGATNDRH